MVFYTRLHACRISHPSYSQSLATLLAALPWAQCVGQGQWGRCWAPGQLGDLHSLAPTRAPFRVVESEKLPRPGLALLLDLLGPNEKGSRGLAEKLLGPRPRPWLGLGVVDFGARLRVLEPPLECSV